MNWGTLYKIYFILESFEAGQFNVFVNNFQEGMRPCFRLFLSIVVLIQDWITFSFCNGMSELRAKIACRPLGSFWKTQLINVIHSSVKVASQWLRLGLFPHFTETCDLKKRVNRFSMDFHPLIVDRWSLKKFSHVQAVQNVFAPLHWLNWMIFLYFVKSYDRNSSRDWDFTTSAKPTFKAKARLTSLTDLNNFRPTFR